MKQKLSKFVIEVLKEKRGFVQQYCEKRNWQ